MRTRLLSWSAASALLQAPQRRGTLANVAVLLALAGLTLALPARAGQAYGEPWRPQFHFSPERNWMNDPNGLVYYEGEYHLFYQYNPLGDRWGHMTWAHAVSPDLVHWAGLPDALPEEKNVMMFSGSAVVDWGNSSGFGRNGQPPLVAVYTGHHTDRPLQNQNIAYSNDRGRTWTKYAGNPVLDIGDADFRDPKVFWYEPDQHWIMVVAWPQHHQVRLYASPDLRHWVHLSDFGPAGSTAGVWECPDLFPLPVEGLADVRKWVLVVNVGSGAPAGGSGCQYFVGRFDGHAFTPDDGPGGTAPRPAWADWGRDFYAAVSWNDLPPSPGRRIWIGWMSNWDYGQDVPTSPWRSAMTIPRTLSLRRTDRGWLLVQHPVEELRKLRHNHRQASLGRVSGSAELTALASATGGPFELAADFEPSPDAVFDLVLRNGAEDRTVVRVDVRAGRISVDRTHSGRSSFNPKFPCVASAPLRLVGGRVQLRLFVDASSVELFAGDGETVLTSLIFPEGQPRPLLLSVERGALWNADLDAWTLTSIWNPGPAGARVPAPARPTPSNE